jgi:transcription elongation factor GreB
LGDRSENAEYKEGKRMLRAIDSRVRFLMKRLEQVKVVEYSPQQEGKVYFGAYVRLQNDQDEVLICRIVGSDEIDTEKKHITIDSPMARALLGKEEGDEIAVTTPTGVKYWEVIDIRYRPFDSLEV